MANATTAEAPANTCPDWCASPHDGDEGTFHYGEAQYVKDIYGKLVAVSTFWDQENRRAGIAVGEHEFAVEESRQLVSLADRASTAAILTSPGSR